MTQPQSELNDDTFAKPVVEEKNPEPDGSDIITEESAQ